MRRFSKCVGDVVVHMDVVFDLSILASNKVKRMCRYLFYGNYSLLENYIPWVSIRDFNRDDI